MARDGPEALDRAAEIDSARASALDDAWCEERPSRPGPAARPVDAQSACTLLDTDSIVLGLTDAEPRVREQAIKLAEPRLEREPALCVEAGFTGRRSRSDGPISTRLLAGRGHRRSTRDHGPGRDRRSRCREPVDSHGSAELDRRSIGGSPRSAPRSKPVFSRPSRAWHGSTSWRSWSARSENPIRCGRCSTG